MKATITKSTIPPVGATIILGNGAFKGYVGTVIRHEYNGMFGYGAVVKLPEACDHTVFVFNGDKWKKSPFNKATA